jgi:parvulin-like peptidyl-prolyl isomerase
MSLRRNRFRPRARHRATTFTPPALLIAALLLLPACSGGVGTYFAPTAAVVGGAGIAEEQLVAHLRITESRRQFTSLFQGPDAARNRLDTKRQILSLLIRETAVVQDARRQGVSVDDRQVAAALDADRQGATPPAFNRLLRQAGVTLADLELYERTKLTVNAATDRVTKSINASADQIAATYQANKASYDAAFRPAHILVCGHLDPSTRQCNVTPDDLALARSINQRAAAGADFGALARQYSVDAGTKDKGGDLGWVTPGSLVQGFEQAALALQPGQVTARPVQTPFGYHVIKLTAKGRSLADASDDINAQLEQSARNRAIDTWLRGLLARTTIRIDPRFGTYDPNSARVVPPPGLAPPLTPPGP